MKHHIQMLFKTRRLQVCVVSASVLFVLWLCTTMWLNALDQLKLVHNFRLANQQEELLFKLAESLSAERRLMYVIYNSESVDHLAVEKLRKLSTNTSVLLRSSEASLVSMHATIEQRGNDELGHNHSLKTSAVMDHSTMMSSDLATHDMPHSKARMTTSNSPASKANTIYDNAKQPKDAQPAISQSSAQHIVEELRQDDANLYRQLLLNRSDRQPMYGMMKFHDYTSTIEAIDGLRHALHEDSNQRLPEHYIATKLKDAFWNFRESVTQNTALLEGIVSKSDASDEMAQTTHHAEMLIELNVRVDVSWNALVKTISASGNNSIITHADSTAKWYQENFKRKSYELAKSARNDEVSLDAIREWLAAAHRLSALSEDVRSQAQATTMSLINKAERRTTINLIQVSVIVLMSFCMALASLFLFRRVDRQAHQDELTGLDNRRMFSKTLATCLVASKASASQAGILMIDLDRFKYINDTMGHAAGDRLLKEVSKRIAEAGHECRSIARLGGDEFAILLDHNHVCEIETMADSIRQSMIDPFHINGATLEIGSSIGIAKYPADAQTPDSLLQAADLAMYCAKKSGTNQISTYDSQVDQSMAVAAKTVNELQDALRNNEFELVYQPQFNLAQAKVLSAEALIRWNHPKRGHLTPYHFISVAEESGLMPAIGDWVIGEACRQAAFWLHEKNMPLRVAVNISADHFFQPNFVQKIIAGLDQHKLPPQFLEVEVTESVAMNDIELVVESLRQLRELSIHVALDDFGTGYSSLSYLQELPLDTLKIDKSFIQKMLHGDTRMESITETIVALGRKLDLETVAEGVETADQLTAVSDMQISVVQGYYYSKPVSAAEVELVVQQLNHKQKAA